MFPSSLWITFKSPWLLLCLLLIPVVVALYVWLERRRAARAARWASPALLPNMVAGSPGSKRYIPAAIFGLAVLFLLVGFARPQAKFRTAKDGATVVLMVDVSGSMGANDVKPSRLLAADDAITQFVKKLPSKYRAALVTFSNAITVKVPPTYDRTALLAALPKKTELEGTALGDALTEAVLVAQKAVGKSTPGHAHPPASILLVSDGGQNAGTVQPNAAAAKARKAGIAVSTVSVGTASGTVHQKIPYGTQGKTFPLVSQVPVDATTLKSVAKTSGGHFYAAHSATQLEQVYKQLGTKLVYADKYREITVDVTIGALVLILVAAGLSAYWFRRLV
jgi:Ca-activated chloride channel homolog